MKRRLVVSLCCLVVGAGSASADELLGVPLPAPSTISVTSGCYPPPCSEYGDVTWMTPFVASQPGVIGTWRGQFLPGRWFGSGCVLPTHLQLKVFRLTSATTAQVVAAGAVHNPKAILEAQYGRECPLFMSDSEESLIEFSEAGVEIAAGDAVGLMLSTDPEVGQFLYPFVNVGAISRSVVRDVAIGDTIDLSDIYTGSFPNAPAMQVIVAPAVADGDGDGVADAADACPASAPGAGVDASGCSIDDRCPCGGAAWRNHGAYVSCVAHAAEAMMLSGAIDAAQKDAAVSAAAASRCGAKR